MLYVIVSGGRMTGIAKRFDTTINAIMEANVICNSNFILTGQPLIIPEPEIQLPKADGYPYYVTHNGDTLWCLANQFAQTISSLFSSNQIINPNQTSLYLKEPRLLF